VKKVGTDVEAMTAELSTDQQIAILDRMLLIRRFEEMLIDLAGDHNFGHYHLYIGEEATGATVVESLRETDLLLTTWRNHGHLLARGADPGRMVAEILGRVDGYNKGRGGTLHLTARDVGFLSTSGLVGGAVGLASGAGYALKQAGEGNICVVFFGDGALEEGVVFEAMNLASLWSLPVLFLCENNNSGAISAREGGFPSSEIAASQISDIPKSLNIRTRVVDGASVSAVHAAVADAVSDMRKGGGPVFIEAYSERWPGSRPLWPEQATAVTQIATAWDESLLSGEHASWIRDFDPVIRFIRNGLDSRLLRKQDVLELDARVCARIARARVFGEASAYPDPQTALSGVFAA
jgi:TPP-dependent pyruvate/acetoin dehydrogenase alpha subunit